jgi:hypothetical protein
MADSFKALMKIRDHIVTGGYDFDLEQTKALLWHHLGRLDQDTIELFADPKVETYEKYCRARELVSLWGNFGPDLELKRLNLCSYRRKWKFQRAWRLATFLPRVPMISIVHR